MPARRRSGRGLRHSRLIDFTKEQDAFLCQLAKQESTTRGTGVPVRALVREIVQAEMNRRKMAEG